MRKRPLLAIACVFLTGLAWQRYQTAVILLFPVALFVEELFWGVRCKKWKRWAVRSILLLAAFFLGVWNMQKEETFRIQVLSAFEEGDAVTVLGEMKSFEAAEYGNRCILTDCYIRIQEEVTPCNDIMVYTSSDHFQVGEIHEIAGQFKKFSEARNQGNFDALTFYQSQKIDFIVEETQSQKLGESLNFVEQFLLSLKENFIQVYQYGMEEKAAGFYIGMILGDRSNLEDSIKDLFAIGGISHILAISGLHVSMIGKSFYRLLRRARLGFGVAGIVGALLLLAYVYMVGGSMSAVRAAGMLLFYLLAQYMGRSYDMLNALGGMCIVLLWENPFLIEYSGFWFSVLALLGVGVVGATFSQSQGKKVGMKNVKASFWTSVGITITTLPVVAYNYYEIPIYSPLVNMVLLPILTPVFLLAVLGGLIGLWFPAVAKILFIPCAWLLSFYEWTCSMVKTLPGASIICGKPEWSTLVLYAIVLGGGIWWLQRDFLKRQQEAQEKGVY